MVCAACVLFGYRHDINVIAVNSKGDAVFVKAARSTQVVRQIHAVVAYMGLDFVCSHFGIGSQVHKISETLVNSELRKFVPSVLFWNLCL
jgi:hypothetical protein